MNKKIKNNIFLKLWENKTDGYSFDMNYFIENNQTNMNALNNIDFGTDDIDEYIDKTKNELEKDLLKKIKNKLSNSENRCHNKNRNDTEDVRISYVFIMCDAIVDKINKKYNEELKCEIHVKLTNLSKNLAYVIVKYLVNKSSEKNSLMLENDINEKCRNGDNSNNYYVCYLRFRGGDSLVNLFKKGLFFSIDNAMIDSLKEEYNKISVNIKNNDMLNTYKYIDYIIQIYKKRIECLYDKNEKENKREKYIKSSGEFWCIVTLILLINSNIFINVSNINNPNGSKHLEIDFYVSEYCMAIEIDGSHHKNKKKQMDNDRLKEIILGTEKIGLIRFSDEGINSKNSTLYTGDESLYNKICNYLYTNTKNNINVINIDDYTNVCKYIKDNTILKNELTYYPKVQFNYKYEDAMINDKYKMNIAKEYFLNQKYNEIKKCVEKYENDKLKNIDDVIKNKGTIDKNIVVEKEEKQIRKQKIKYTDHKKVKKIQ
jgi:hypothetical protein